MVGRKEMSMNIRNQFTARALLVYLVALAAAWILTEVVWGATAGLVGGLSAARNPEYQQKVISFMKDKGVDSDASRAEALKAGAASYLLKDITHAELARVLLLVFF
jgi:DNA-binding NarL/FixJ family response regulator